MIDVNSNCSRVDSVKAMAAQLRMQAVQLPHTVPESPAYRKVQGQLDALDTEVKKGDARQAETALASAKSVLNSVESQPETRRLDAYA
jgi:hypothetical protein